MFAMVLRIPGQPLLLEERPDPEPAIGEVRLRVEACTVCRTDLHIVDGELTQAQLPIVPGHEIVGVIDRLGAGGGGMQLGQRVGVPWLGHSCGHCAYCAQRRENLWDAPRFTGHWPDGGFATHVLAEAAFCLPLAVSRAPRQMAPLFCCAPG